MRHPMVMVIVNIAVANANDIDKERHNSKSDLMQYLLLKNVVWVSNVGFGCLPS